MEDLRVRIAELAIPLLPAGLHPSAQHQKCMDLAERILAIPEIAEALALKAHRDTKVGYERQG